MEITRSIKCNEIKKYEVVDADGNEVGHISDFTFAFDGNLEFRQFILAGSAWEEFLESVKIKPDKDPVFDASIIKSIGKKIHLTTNTDTLKTTCDNDSIPNDEFRLSELEKMDIFDSAGNKVGRALDVHFDSDGSASLIVGGGLFEEALEAAGIKEDVDLIVPGNVITEISDTMKLKVTKEQLNTTMEKAFKERTPEVAKARAGKTVNRDIGKVRLFSHRPL